MPEFESVYQEFKNLVYNLSLNYVQNTHDAQDIAQEVFVKVHHNLHKYDPAAASLKTWIYRITINHCIDHIKKQRTIKRFGFFQSKSNEPVHYDHPGIAAEDKEELHKLFSAINTLPLQQKTVLILTKIEDRPQREVAEIMHLNLKAVESLLQRAKQNLAKKYLQTKGI